MPIRLDLSQIRGSKRWDEGRLVKGSFYGFRCVTMLAPISYTPPSFPARFTPWIKNMDTLVKRKVTMRLNEPPKSDPLLSLTLMLGFRVQGLLNLLSPWKQKKDPYYMNTRNSIPHPPTKKKSRDSLK